MNPSILAPASAQSPSSAEQQLTHRLEARITIAWEGQELGPALERLAAAQHIPLWIDRRIDPQAAVKQAGEDRPLSEVVAELAAAHGAATTPFHGILYFGPPQAAADIATLAAQARAAIAKAAPDVRSRWLTPQPWSYPRLSEPRQLLAALVKLTGATLQDDQLVAHDLWPARSLPATAALDRVILLLAGFDLTPQISADGRHVRVVPIQRPVRVTREYAIRRDRQAAVESLLAETPTISVRKRGQRLILSARIEEHDRVRSAMRGPAAPPATRGVSDGNGAPAAAKASKRRFTLKVENQPVRRIIDQLAGQLQLQVEWSQPLQDNPAKGPDALTSCDVREGNLDGLLTAILSPVNLAFERDGQKLKIRGAD